MPLPILDVPTYPFVPLMPGVPPLLRAPVDVQAPALLAMAASTGINPPLLTSMLGGEIPSMLNDVTAPVAQLSAALNPSAANGDTASQVSGSTSAAQWGIFDANGVLVIIPDSVLSMDWRGSSTILDYPIEQGNFESYNKVYKPFEPVVIMRKGGSVAVRQSFVNTLMAIRNDLNLYTVTMPEISYPSVNITDVSFSRKNDVGATVIEATISLKQINVSASSSFTNVANPTSQDAFSDGTVQTTPPTSQQATSAAGGPN